MIVTAGTLYTAVLYGSTSFLMLFYVELLLPVILFLVAVPLMRGVRVQMLVPVSVVEKGQEAVVELRLQNSAMIPSGRVAVEVACYPPMNGKPQKTWFYGRVSAGSRAVPAQCRIQTEYIADCVGNVRMEITKVRCYDLLGFASFPLPGNCWKQIEPETLLVLPAINEVPVYVSRQSRDFAGESEEYSKKRGGADPSETFQIRDYQPGDKLRSIHWKLSAKTDGLMVCENSLPLGCPVVFYMNLHQPLFMRGKRRKKRNQQNFYPRKGQNDKRDSYLQIVASVSRSMVQEGCRHYIVWFDVEMLDIQRCRVETEEDVYEMLLELGKLSMYDEELDLEGLYRQKYHDSPCITKLELGMDLHLYQNGISVVKYSGKEDKLKTQLRETEITV